MKGIEMTANMLAMIIFIVIAALILFMLFGSFAAEAGKPVSTVYYKLLDWLASFVS